MKFWKRVLGTAIIVAMLFSINTTAFADEAERYRSLDEIKTEELINYALNFAKEVDATLELETGDIIPIYDSTNKAVGYSIAYHVSGTPFGYINLNFTYEDPVVEFVIQENARSMYSYLEEDVLVYDSGCQVEKKLYHTTPFEYYVAGTDQNKQNFYFNSKDGKMTSREFDSLKRGGEKAYRSADEVTMDTKYDSHSDLYSDSYETGSTVVTAAKYTSKYSAQKSMLSQYNIMTTTSKYACAVVALTEIANQEGILKNSSIKDTFEALWTATSTSVSSTGIFYGLTITCGSTTDSKLATGMKKYCKDRGKTGTTTKTKSNPAFSFFTDAVDNNYSATLSYRIYESNGKKTGHSVNVVGYCTAKKSGTTSNYLIVADGWYDDAPKYMNYSGIDFVNTYGVKYIIK